MKRKPQTRKVTRLRKMRRDREWTQRFVGEQVGVEPASISLYESGHVWPSKKVAVKLSALFGCRVDELLLEHVEIPA